MSPNAFAPPPFDPLGGSPPSPKSPRPLGGIEYHAGHGEHGGETPLKPPSMNLDNATGLTPPPNLLAGMDFLKPGQNIHLTFQRGLRKTGEQPLVWTLTATLRVNNSPLDRASLANLVKSLFPAQLNDLESLERGVAFTTAALPDLIKLEQTLVAAARNLSDYLHGIRSYLHGEDETIGF